MCAKHNVSAWQIKPSNLLFVFRNAHMLIINFFPKYLKADFLMYLRSAFFAHEQRLQPFRVAHDEETDVLLPAPAVVCRVYSAAVAFYCKITTICFVLSLCDLRLNCGLEKSTEKQEQRYFPIIIIIFGLLVKSGKLETD